MQQFGELFMAKETILRCDECNEQINNGRFLVVFAEPEWYCVLKRERDSTKKYEFKHSNPSSKEFDLCSEGCLVKFEAKLREKL